MKNFYNKEEHKCNIAGNIVTNKKDHYCKNCEQYIGCCRWLFDEDFR